MFWQKKQTPSMFLLMFLLVGVCLHAQADQKLRIIVFGAHPDDCELKAGGMAAKWAAQGYAVKFVSATNGDIGHATMAGGPLAIRRTAEVHEAANVLGITSQVLDNHDGELMPTLENRKTFVRLIRDWQADIVIGPRTNDYHPDHRYTGVLMQDAAYMVTVKFFCPDTPNLTRNPVFLYLSDGFQKPAPFEPDIVVAIDDVFEQKVKAIWKLESQIESLWETGGFEKIVPIPTDEAGRQKRFDKLYARMQSRDGGVADRFRGELGTFYGDEKGAAVKTAEAFEVCEYGRQPSDDELKKIFLLP